MHLFLGNRIKKGAFLGTKRKRCRNVFGVDKMMHLAENELFDLIKS